MGRTTPYSRSWRRDKAFQALRQAEEAGGVVRRYNDTLLIFLLKRLRPERYKECVEVRGALANLDALPDEVLARIAVGEHPLSVLASATPELRAEAPGLPPASSGGRGEDRDREGIG